MFRTSFEESEKTSDMKKKQKNNYFNLDQITTALGSRNDHCLNFMTSDSDRHPG